MSSIADKVDNWRNAGNAGNAGYPANQKDAFSFMKRQPTHKKPHQQSYVGPWYPLEVWSKKFNCGLCKEVLKDKSAQRVDCCEALYCEECINTHYNVEHKSKCPCCDEFLSPSDDPDYCTECGSGKCRCSAGCDDDDYCEEYEEYENDGTLGCGCIDVCRGRCGAYYF
jgi:hypothetical protein